MSTDTYNVTQCHTLFFFKSSIYYTERVGRPWVTLCCQVELGCQATFLTITIKSHEEKVNQPITLSALVILSSWS